MIRTSAIAPAAALATALAASPALATGEVYCEATDDSGAIFGYDFGTVPGLGLISATIRAGGKHWSMVEAEGAIPIILAQGAHDGMTTLIDFADPEFITILASVRLIGAVEGDDYVNVGYLHIPGVGVFPLTCE